MSYPSRRSDPGETATEPSIGPGRSQTIKLGLASMSDVNVSTYANYPPDRPLTKAEEAALHSQQARMAAHNAATGSAPMYQPPSSSTPIAAMSTSLSAGSSGGLPSKLEKERIADLHYAHLNNQSASPSAPITTGAVAQNATITVLEPPSYATPPSPLSASLKNLVFMKMPLLQPHTKHPQCQLNPLSSRHPVTSRLSVRTVSPSSLMHPPRLPVSPLRSWTRPCRMRRRRM
ncbi:hypothetical protein BC829DRAFT_285580 [Chytridium lagenaria]|nr:hypothetical protein BC829DRAFT_285580 [Chytridium lagenaria]